MQQAEKVAPPQLLSTHPSVSWHQLYGDDFFCAHASFLELPTLRVYTWMVCIIIPFIPTAVLSVYAGR